MIQGAVQKASSKWQGRRTMALYLARLLVTTVLLAIAFQWVDFDSVVSVLAGVDGRRFMLSMVAFAGAQMLFAKRTQMLLMLQNMPASVLNVFSLNLASAFYTLVFPTSLAGGLVRWHRMSSVDGERAQAFSVLLFERVLDNYCWVLLLWAASFSLALRRVVPFWLMIATTFALGAMTVVGYVAFVMLRNSGADNKSISEKVRFIPRSILVRIKNLHQALRSGVVAPEEFRKIMFLSFVLNMVFQWTIYSMLAAVVPQMAFDQYLLVNMVVTILVQLPITIVGIGLNEMIFGQILPLLGMSSVSALSAGIVGSSINIIWGLIGGGFELVGLGQFRK